MKILKDLVKLILHIILLTFCIAIMIGDVYIALILLATIDLRFTSFLNDFIQVGFVIILIIGAIASFILGIIATYNILLSMIGGGRKNG